jgi:hypothetical protein
MRAKFTDPEKLAPEATSIVEVVSEVVFTVFDARFAYEEFDVLDEPLLGSVVKYWDTLDIWESGVV